MHNKGGRGKKAGYASVTVRVPLPIKQEVLRLIDAFHQSNTNKPVTSIDEACINKPITGIDEAILDKPVTSIDEANPDKPVTGIEKTNTDENIPIEKLDLPFRIYKILKHLQIHTIQNLILYTEEDLLGSGKGLGKKSVEDIKNILRDSLGLTLTTSAKPKPY
ncbi:MAG: DNA-directed RNA polymerase subunit alpha C-terminal domain-containing protein [Rhizonema sp. NSF051]|nr:DNA-directed RNA polymerase subunit alpha C-terminal domain-containing protein [Rhizonema sp. NSF051]